MQKLLGVNIGRRSWVDWMDFVEGATDELPGLSSLADFAADPPPLPEELIQGVLRRGHKMLISGSSKAGKSFLLMELCAAIAEGKPWLGFSCRKGRVLYVNLEIDPASCVNRFIKIYDALGYDRKHIDDIIIWNLRGHAVPLDQLVPKLIRRVRDQHLDAIIMEDTIAKIIDMQEEINGDIDALVDLKREILACIRAVADPEHQMLLEQRYLCFQPWERIAESLGYSINNIYRMHSKALSEVTVPKIESFEQ